MNILHFNAAGHNLAEYFICMVDHGPLESYTQSMPLFIEYPSWISPYVFTALPIRWYSLMYIVAFGITFALYVRQLKRKEIDGTVDDAMNLFLYAIAGLIVGARLFSALVYDGSWYYWRQPWLIFWPFRDGRFVGLPGMSYHGGLVGAVLGVLLYCRRERKDFLSVADALVAGIPLGYTFGRLGNFINGELWGRVSFAPWAMVFPDAPRQSTTLEWVRTVADRIGLPYAVGEMVNLPRHPSQLYEALFEGVFLWLVLWFIVKPRRRHPGTLLSWYLIGYGAVRFVIEYLREPDANLGFILAWGGSTKPTALFESVFNISLGQIFCLAMIVSGLFLLWFIRARSVRQAESRRSAMEAEQRRLAAVSSRKQRKKRKK